MQCLTCDQPVHEPDDVICEDCIESEHYEEIHEPQKAYSMGDLGYVIRGEEEWMSIVNSVHADKDNPNYGKHSYKDGDLYIFSAVNGDGIYTASYRNEMSHVLLVDSGSIGVIPMSLLEGVTASDTTVIYLTDAEFNRIRSEDGVIYVGGYNINTK